MLDLVLNQYGNSWTDLVSELEERFKKQRYVTAAEREELANSLGLSATQVGDFIEFDINDSSTR
ncbi:hypothetical protein KIN20_006877 [Parelaphostrongylus tenuis]|uniref:Homeobox domain-containing protein n=1 Tax=Parelaphostrongylus tenuis TaxID=148309 RepID=A0AAD5ML32_PARTN|nr:hypothetical protein KIN20_006877 [Parelaphostrongylus tenuis]